MKWGEKIKGKIRYWMKEDAERTKGRKNDEYKLYRDAEKNNKERTTKKGQSINIYVIEWKN